MPWGHLAGKSCSPITANDWKIRQSLTVKVASLRMLWPYPGLDILSESVGIATLHFRSISFLGLGFCEIKSLKSAPQKSWTLLQIFNSWMPKFTVIKNILHWAIRHYRLWSFKTRDTKLERYLHENQHTQRKLLNFENWTNGKPQ